MVVSNLRRTPKNYRALALLPVLGYRNFIQEMRRELSTASVHVLVLICTYMVIIWAMVWLSTLMALQLFDW